MNGIKFVRNRSGEPPGRLVWGLLVAFLLAALLTAYLTFKFVRLVVASMGKQEQELALEQAAPTRMPLDPRILTAPLQAEGPDGKPWDRKSRVNILFLGLDFRDWEDGYGPARTDTMILFTLDPESRSAGMLSIPRDLWVSIPGFDNAKINTAYFLGEAYGLPGGGPGLAIETVEQLLDITIHFYARVDFSAFESLIDEIGGIEVDVPEEITVDPVGPDNTVHLQAGRQMLNGPVALAYARARNTAGNDFDRAQRQQQVIFAIRNRILNLNILPTLIEKSPILYQQLSSGVHTNLTLEQVIAMAWLAQQIPEESIKRGAIGVDQVEFAYSWDGQDILQPLPTEIRLLRDEVFTISGPPEPIAPVGAAPTGDPEELRRIEAARVSVLNGTYTPGLAAQTTEYLLAREVDVVSTDNAQDVYELTTIVDYSGKIYTSRYLSELLNVDPAQIANNYNPNSPVDIAVYLGNDWAAENPMP